jgi:hypothetical protein
MVRSAARRGVVFGFLVGEGSEERRKCEAVMNGIVVEPSFAKGDWSIVSGITCGRLTMDG